MNALETVNSHYQAIIEKNITAICSKYVPDESTYVVLEGPRLTTQGFTKIKKGWTDFCASSITLQAIHWVEGPQVNEQQNMAWVAGIINLQVAIDESVFTNTFRSTFVLLQYNGEWKIQHEHVSVAHPDPYGIGDWLKK